MLDLALTGFFVALLVMGLRRPFIWVLAYLYIDVVQPQRMSYRLLVTMEPSLIAFVFSVAGFALLDRKHTIPPSWRQGLIIVLLFYCGVTTQFAEFAGPAADKWAWVWKALVFAAFLPFTLGTRLRLEGAALVMVLSAAALIIDGALKTLAGGGGYGELHLFVDNNTSLYEGSILSAVSVSIIPLIVWLARHGTVFPPDRRVRLFAAGLVLSCLLIPVGTAARTGLVCAGLLAVMMLRSAKNPALYAALMVGGALLAVPLLPKSYTERMNTIGHANADESASTRLAVWAWTLDYANHHPFGGGFEAYRGDKLHMQITDTSQNGSGTSVQIADAYDKARAFHSAYFEMLGEQGWPGLALWLVLQLSGLAQLEGVRRRLKKSTDPRDRSDRALATALQEGHIVYLLGAGFVGIAFQPFVYMLIGLQIALTQQVRRRLSKPRVAQAGQVAVGVPVLAG